MAFNFFQDDGIPREIHQVTADSTVTAQDFIRGVYYISADLSAGNVTTTFDVGIPEDSIIYAGVSVESGANQHILFSSDPAAKPFVDNEGNAEADGGAHIDVEGFAIFKVTATNIIQIDGQAADMGEETEGPVTSIVNTHAELPDPTMVIAGSIYYVINDTNTALNGQHLAAGSDTGSPATYWEQN